MALVNYLIEGDDIKKRYGIFVSDSQGVVGRPKLKKRDTFSWDNYHGEVIDLEPKYYEPREIVLGCFIKADSKIDFIEKVLDFSSIFDGKGTQRLMIDVGNERPLVYEVYCKDEIEIVKKWSEDNLVGTFKLKLIEPEPVKRVLSHNAGTNSVCSFKITTNKLVNVYWGDGKADYDISGNNITVSHTYNGSGLFYPIITGCIDEIAHFSINSTTATKIVWYKL